MATTLLQKLENVIDKNDKVQVALFEVITNLFNTDPNLNGALTADTINVTP